MKDLSDIHAEAIKNFQAIQTAMRDERLQCLQDRRFYSISGAQWEGALGRQFENKPRFEINKIHLSVIRIINEYRNNRIDVQFIGKDNKEADKLAETCAGIFRADEQDSGAQEAYDNAFEEAVGGGFGAWRLVTAYEDDDNLEDETQRIRFEPIYDADSSVFFDLDAKRQDKSDAKYAFVIHAMTPEAYLEQFGETPSMFTKTIQLSFFDWTSPRMAYVAEYYKVEDVSVEYSFFKNQINDEEKYEKKELTEEMLKNIYDRGFIFDRKRKVKKQRVHKYIISGQSILEDCGYIAGENIPIVPVYGKRWFIDNVERCMGHVRLAKDAQRIKNMQLSKLGEIAALSSFEKPIFTPEQIAGHGYLWARDNIDNNPYLLVNPVTDANGNISLSGPVGYTKPPQVPPAMAALLQVTDADMNDILGNQQAGEQVVSAMSGKAVELIQNRLDMQTFIYVSNMEKAVKRCGEIWLSMAKEILVEEGRRLKIITEQEQTDYIELSKPVISDNGSIEYENDLSNAKFDVVATTGPSSVSKKAATVRAVTGMLQLATDPTDQAVLSAMAMMNMEGEGISDVRDYYRKKLLRMGVLQPTKEEAQQLAQEAQMQQPDAQTLYLQAAAQNEQAKAQKAQVDMQKTLAESDKIKAETMEKMAELDRGGQRHFLDSAEKLMKLQQESNNNPVAPAQQPQESTPTY